ncbi:MAG: rod shape-determining protein [Spirochaetes bacterium]|nr:rod shape-determining protein [Spirochaetota bacterium]
MNQLLSVFSNDFGIDLGTANTLVYVEGEGIVLNEPSVVAIEKTTNRVLAVGREAKRMLGRTPGNIVAVRPMRDGVIADFDIVEKMIRYFIHNVSKRRNLIKPRIVIGVPSGITEVEKRAVKESCEQAGAREVFLIEEPRAAAIGARMPVDEPAGNMIVDIGGGTTEIAVISLGSMVVENSIRVAGDEFDKAIQEFMRKNHNLIIGETTAENIKIEFIDVYNFKGDETYEVKGRDPMSGLPRTQPITRAEMRDAIEEPLGLVIGAVKAALEQTPPELAADIIERGIVLSGGGALIRGLKNHLSDETGVPVIVAQDPLHCVVNGCGIYLGLIKTMGHKREYLKI